ncbi:MAG TPA: cupin domain-containing protein [Dongiaceae bacterium]|jgi:quercetin dioxygenase-like cupin family protein|nr:cupin domain-containing protein [Dongiaceae bacterium]
MAARRMPTYEVADYEVLAETPELRMVVLTLGEGQEVPWHWHTNVTDRFFCMQGPMVVETRAPREVFELSPGDTCIVPARRAHHVIGKNGGPCKFGVLQGVGLYDFNPVGS